jgi:mono/diheme cytochrome c family protein
VKIQTGLLLVLGLAVSWTGFSLAQDPIGDPVAGRRLVVGRCSACHAGDPSMDEPLMGARTFAEVANQQSTTSYRIRTFLRTSHATMPNYILSPDEIDDIAAYIMSLKRRRP